MAQPPGNLNDEVTRFLDGLNHPFRAEIEELRVSIVNAHGGLTETIKWNGPNYSLDKADRITMRIHPPGKIQLIFHRGAKVQEQPENRLLNDDAGLLIWKENDRAIATFTNLADVVKSQSALTKIVQDWISATC